MSLKKATELGQRVRNVSLETTLRQMQERCEAHLQEPDLHLAKQKVLSRMPLT